MLDSLQQRLTDGYDNLTDREQLWVKIAGVVLPLVLLTFVGLVFNNSLSSVRSDIDQKEELLEKLAEIAPEYRKNKKQGKAEGKQARFSPEALKENNVKLTSFVATHATAVGITVNSYDESERPISGSGEEGNGDKASLYKADVTVEIRDVTTSKLLKLLERIEMADKPVVIERVTLTNNRRKKGKVRADIIVTTYKRKAKG